jgi:hypothetical protein
MAVPSQQSASLLGPILPSDIALSDDDRYLAVSQKDGGGLLVWDTWSFTSGPVSASTCITAKAVEFASALTSSVRFYVACERGEVYYVDVDSSTTPPTLRSSTPIELNLGSGDVIDLAFAEGDEYVHALVLDAGFMSIHRISVSQDTVTSVVAPQVAGGTPSGLAIGESGTPLVIPRSDGYLSWFDRSGDSYVSATSNVLVSFGGVLSSAAVSSEYGVVMVTDSGQSTLWSMPSIAGSQSTELVSELAGVEWVELGKENGELLAWTAGTGTSVEVYDTAGVLQGSIDLVDSSAVACALSSEGGATAYVAAADGTIRVLSDRPFIEGLSTSAAIVGSDEPFSVSFSSTQDGAWELSLGGSGVQGSGTSLATGDALAGELVSVELTAASLSTEGANQLFVFVSASTGVAVDSVSVTLDEPPGALAALALSAGDSRVVAEWTSGGEEDVASFVVYLSDAPFASGDSILPEFSVETTDGTIVYPLTVDAGIAEESHSLQIDGLSNGVPYFLAIKAVDEGGLEGPLSEVVSAVPEATCGAAECAGDNYGCSCSASFVRPFAGSSGYWLLLLTAGPLFARRRRSL